jgi:hypothetical protein
LIFGTVYALDRSLPTNGSSRKGLPRKVAQAAARKSWLNRDLPNWRDRVGDRLRGIQILVKDLREVNALYVEHAASSFPVHNLLSLPKVFTIARLNLLQPKCLLGGERN